MVDKVHVLAVMIVCCLVVVVSSGLFWHLWHSWGNLVLAQVFVVTGMTLVMKNLLKR